MLPSLYSLGPKKLLKKVLTRPPLMSQWRTSTLVCAIDTYTTSPLSSRIVAPQPAVSLDLKSFGMLRPRSSVARAAHNIDTSRLAIEGTLLSGSRNGEIHDRMPILDKADFGTWLSGKGGAELLRSAAEEKLQMWPVSRARQQDQR